MWSKYPDNHHEQKWAGVCLWYQHRLMDDDVFEHRECEDFFEHVPGLMPMDHFDYKIKRDNLGDAYVQARFSKRLALLGAGLSVISLTLSLWKVFGA